MMMLVLLSLNSHNHVAQTYRGTSLIINCPLLGLL